MIAAKKEWCNICKCEHIEGNHIEQECEDCKTLGWTCAICDMRTYPRKKIYANEEKTYNLIKKL